MFIFITACNEKSYTSPEGYDLQNPRKMMLGKALVEISGIAYRNSSGHLLAISDSKRTVFEINYVKTKLKDFVDKAVPSDSDLEDIALVNDNLYLLASRGTLYEIPPGVKDSSGINVYELSSEGQNDFETLYYDSTLNSLILLCKSCALDKGNQKRSAYRFDLGTKTFDSTELFAIDSKEVKELLKDDDGKFDPSAAAIHPIDKRLYILSSAGSLLVIADTRGKVLEVYKLNPDLYPQAEGIAFAPDGTMLISNEGRYGNATLLIFPYKSREKKK